MYEIIAVTNRHMCEGDFLKRIEAVAESGVSAIMLREKDLEPKEYESLAGQVSDVCARRGAAFIAHRFIAAARRLGCGNIHLSASAFAEGDLRGKLKGFSVGVSVHSVEEARYAASRGAGYLVAGHIFQTGCKKGLPARGLGFLSEICGQVSIPVYAIGGISEQNIGAVRESGAAGACLMSSFMRSADVAAYTASLLPR